MSCPERLETISAYLDGELTGAELEAFREHLGVCADCRRELAEQERVWEVLGEFKTKTAGPGLTGRILGATVGEPARAGAGMRVLRWAGPLAAAAGLLVAVLLTQWPEKKNNKLDAETMAVIQKLDVLEHLDVLENMDLLQEALKEPILIEDPETVGPVLEEGSS